MLLKRLHPEPRPETTLQDDTICFSSRSFVCPRKIVSFRFLILQMHKTENGIETTTTKIENKVGNATREFKKNIRGLMKSTHMHYAPQPTVERNGHKEREIEVK